MANSHNDELWEKYFNKPKWLIKIDKKVSALYIKYGDRKLEKLLNDDKLLIRAFGVSNARKIILRLNQIKAASSLGAILTQRVGRCHPLSGDRMGQFAFDVEQPYRLIVMPKYDNKAAEQAKDLSQVKTIIVMEVTDYHG